MARALPAGPTPRRRAFFGLLDADGWGWASLKAAFWFVVIIFLLAYVPDRAYYFTVSRTIDLGILAWSPVNLCPPNNESVPCPAPVGAILPWHPSPSELALPAPRVDASFVQVGTQVLLIGGTDGQTATNSVLVARTSGVGNYDKWEEGPALPEPRADMAVTSLNGVVYAVGGYDESGQPANTGYVLRPNLQSGELGEWQTAEDSGEPLDLPEPRAGAGLLALPDGLLLVGGVGPDQRPTNTVWKSTFDTEGAAGEWTPQREMFEPAADAVAVVNGDFVWVIGGRDGSDQPTNRVQRGTLSGGATGDQAGEGEEADDPADEGGGLGDDAAAQPVGVEVWAVSGNPAVNLPAARVDAMGLATNGTIYVVGGTDGQTTQNDLFWAVPAAGADGDDLGEWKQLEQTNLPEPGLAGAAIGVSGPNLFVVGGVSGDQPQVGAARANTAPEEPFFQLGLVGMVVPALKIEGEIGQQLGYLNAAGVGGLMFAILLVIGYMFAHREQTRRFFERMRRRGRA